MPKIISFDVFDTLLTRKVGQPRDIFLLTGLEIEQRYQLGIDPEVFANARELAESELAGSGGCGDDIYAIYEYLTGQLAIPKEFSAKLGDTEVEIEFQEITAVERHVHLLQQLRRKGHRIIYISDMYLGEPVIRKLLDKHGIREEGEQVYVSCEYGASKSGGELFKIAARDLGTSPEQLHHYGNSRRADIQGAEQVGVTATYLPECNLNRYEKYLCEVKEDYRLDVGQTLLYSRMGAACRLSRLQRRTQKPTIYDVAASVAAPVLYRFVAHVLEAAAGKRIYFLARDGHIMYQIAERIIQAREGQSKISYLYISREALVLASYGNLREDEYLEYLMEIFTNESLHVVLKKLSVTGHSLQQLKLADKDLSKLIAEFEKEELKKIFRNKSIQRDVNRNSENRKNRLLTYLQRKGLLTDDETAIVDVGWGLTIQNLMADLLSNSGVSLPEGFYLGINESAGASIQKGKKNGFLWDQRKEKFFKPPHKIIRIFEVFCSAPHGQTIDYKIEGEEVQAIFNSHESRHLVEWGLNEMQSGILNSVEYLIQADSKFQVSDYDSHILMKLVEMFWLYPTDEEIKVWGKYPYSIIKHDRKVVNLFEKVPFNKLFVHTLKRGKLPNSSLDHWPRAYLNSLSPLKRSTVIKALKLKRSLSDIKQDITTRLT